ncbi:flagellin [Acuticoccus sp. MNP-M23]|uniref:flagellin N-terminal helical domain-containing protein n=1 Tax=Acuticoccus sp. MNP-M23 TaxID=3072793 RepID=UPI00281669A9|nr:flagellin [Acuticoccus sp. MNP-M23]WMS41789.1 flagellin [Acuticoccus sp. MNP-M23]
MTSLLTNSAAMVALSTLNSINMQLNESNNRVSTGLKIREAQDSAAYWAIATTTQSDNDAMASVKDALAIGRSTLDVTYAGLDAVRENLQTIKELIVSARQPGVDRVNVQTQIAGLQADMTNKANASVMNEQNFLAIADSATENTTKAVVAGFTRSATGVSISTIDLDISAVYLTDGNATPTGILDQDRTYGAATTALTSTALTVDISALTDSADDLTILEHSITLIDTALIEVTTAQNNVGVNLARAETQETFVNALMDANERAVGALIDANMEEESTKLRALQTQQQLAVESLSIANASAQNVLALFR